MTVITDAEVSSWDHLQNLQVIRPRPAGNRGRAPLSSTDHGIPSGITITGGDQITNDGDDWRVPKRELVSRTQVLLETKRLKIASTLPLAATLVAEFDNFRSKKAVLTGHDSYGAGADWREGNHDDLVLSVAMAAWFGEHHATEDVELMESHIALQNYLRASGHPGYQ